MLERSLDRLRRTADESNATDQFERLKAYLTGGDAAVPYREVASQLGMTEGAVKTAVYRLRRSFGGMLRAEIAETVADPADVDDEIRHLLAVVNPQLTTARLAGCRISAA